MTILKYLEDTYLFNSSANCVEVKTLDDGRFSVILDETIFYPQGGGQPADQGVIRSLKGEFTVTDVRFFEGEVYHISDSNEGIPEVGDEVELEVNEDRRILNSRNHTAGHLLDSAMTILGQTQLTPTKGFQFPEGAYVEYDGVVEVEEREQLIKDLETQINKMIAEGFDVKSQLIEAEDLPKYCKVVPEYLPKDKPSRMVVVWDKDWMPCGGTHVKSLSEIGQVSIRKLKCKKGTTKVSYAIS